MGQTIYAGSAPGRRGRIGGERFPQFRGDVVDRRGEGELSDELAIRAEQNHACGAVDRAVLGSGLAHPGVADPEVVGGAALQCG